MSFDWFTFIAQLVNFGLLVFLLRLFLYKPVMNVMEQRQQRLGQAWDEARSAEAAAREEAARLLAERTEVERTRRKRLEQVEAEAQALRKQRIDEAVAAADQEMERQATRLQQERNELVGTLTQKAGEVLVAELKDALSDLADSELDQRASQAFARQLQQLPRDQQAALRAASVDAVPVVSTAFEPTPEVSRLLASAVVAVTGAEKPPRFQVDPSLLFGAALTVGSVRVESSGRKRAQAVESAFNSVLPK